jgi:hypothetical protein
MPNMGKTSPKYQNPLIVFISQTSKDQRSFFFLISPRTMVGSATKDQG